MRLSTEHCSLFTEHCSHAGIQPKTFAWDEKSICNVADIDSNDFVKGMMTTPGDLLDKNLLKMNIKIHRVNSVVK